MLSLAEFLDRCMNLVTKVERSQMKEQELFLCEMKESLFESYQWHSK